MFVYNGRSFVEGRARVCVSARCVCGWVRVGRKAVQEGEMRNLVVISEVHGVVEGDDDSKLHVSAAAVDAANGLFFVASQSSVLICYSLLSSKVPTHEAHQL